MEIVLVVIAFILLAAGIVGAFAPVLPGPPLSYAGLLLIQWSGFGQFSRIFLAVWAVITVVITVMDYILPSFLARRFGGSISAAIGSFLGLLVGIFFFPPFGMIIGPFLGAYAGELIHSGSNGIKAFKVALGAFLAFVIGSGAKLIVSSVMLYYAIKALF